MKILVLFTGGTIGSTVSGGYISTDCKKSYKLLEMYKASSNKDIDFEQAEPYTLLSENLTGETIFTLGNALKDNINKGYDGIIITHGTDTIQYSAAALSYFLPDLSIPVLLVSSNYVLDDKKNNGIANFSASVDFIETLAGKGIFVPYQNSDGITYIHKGTRLLPHLPYSDNLYSIDNQYYAIASENKIEINKKYVSSKENHDIKFALPQSWNSDILRIYPYPGMQYPDLSSKPKAILIDSYHSGTICSLTPGIEEFFTKASSMNIPIFLAGAKDGPAYDSVKLWEKYHINTLPAASPIAMYIKLWMAIDSDNLKDIMKTSVCDDILE